MTPQEILDTCEKEYGVKLLVRDGKLSPAGSLPMTFLKFSSQIVEYKQQIIDYIRQNLPDRVVSTSSPEQKVAINVQGTVNDKVMRLRIPCVNLGDPLESSAGCGCAGKIKHKCAVFGICKRSGVDTDIAVCTSCEKYEPSQK